MRMRVVELLGASPKKILDVACGPGRQTYQLAKAGHSVTGMDLSPDMLRQTKRDPALDLTYLEGDATSMPFSDSIFDVSTISFALHDMPEDLAINVLKEMKRVTKNHGRIIIVDYNQPYNLFSKLFLRLSRLWETQYYWHFIQTGLQCYLEQAGFGPASKKVYLLENVQLVDITNVKLRGFTAVAFCVGG
ncbi:MAG: methyltransferase domain-containing protein [Candidatus Kerfeldbacteria bacterium]|nr:methyltransferase domain-containing protein [Candidatus Kerfeldbacteria bacterium]